MGMVKDFVNWYVLRNARRASAETKDVHVDIHNVNTEFIEARVTNKHTGALQKVCLGSFGRVQLDNAGHTMDVRITAIGKTGFEAEYFDDNGSRKVDHFNWIDLLFTFEW